MKKHSFVLLFVCLLFFACSSGIEEVKPGQIVNIPHSQLYAVGTDSNIVVISRQTGNVTATIKRK